MFIPMNPFQEALLEAQALGAITIRFDVDLTSTYSEADKKLRWTAHANVPAELTDIQPFARGCSGLQAMRLLIIRLQELHQSQRCSASSRPTGSPEDPAT